MATHSTLGTFKQTVKTIIPSFVYMVLTLLTIVFFIFSYHFSFNYETSHNQQYDLVFCLPIVFLYMVFRGKKSLTWLHIIWLSIMTIVFCLLLWSDRYSFANEYFFVLIAIFIISSGILFFSKLNLVQAIVILLLTFFFYELYIGYNQAFLMEMDNGLFLTGTLENSGVYGYYLVVHLPFLYWLFFYWYPHLGISKRKFFKNNFYTVIGLLRWITFIFLMGLVILLVIKTQSRTALISLFITAIAFVIYRYRALLFRSMRTIRKTLLYSVVLILVVGISISGYYLFMYRKLSAMGRVMRLHIAWEHIRDHFWLGTGIGRFTWYYPQWQTQYFQHTANPPHDFLLSAGESYILFNEYLQLFETIGVLGSLILFIVLYCFFKTISVQHKELLIAIKLTVIAILSCGFISYPLHVNILLLLLLFCIMAAIVINDKHWPVINQPRWHFVTYLVMGCLAILTTVATIKGWKERKAINEWAKLEEENKEDVFALIKKYEVLYPVLRNNGKFLTAYGEVLGRDSAAIPEAIIVLERAKQFSLSQKLIMATGLAYDKAKNLPKAIENYEWLANYLPNKFVPKYALLQLYQKTADSLQVTKIATAILQLPVKVASDEIESIKQKAKEIISPKR